MADIYRGIGVVGRYLPVYKTYKKKKKRSVRNKTEQASYMIPPQVDQWDQFLVALEGCY